MIRLLLIASAAFFILAALSVAWSASDPCQVALQNLKRVQDQTKLVIGRAEQLKRSPSTRRLAVLSAKEALGFYSAMRVLLPLACKGEDYAALDGQLQGEIQNMQTYVDKNW